MKDIHVRLSNENYVRLLKLCLHKGDMTYFLQQAVDRYLAWKETRRVEEGGDERR